MLCCSVLCCILWITYFNDDTYTCFTLNSETLVKPIVDLYSISSYIVYGKTILYSSILCDTFIRLTPSFVRASGRGGNGNSEAEFLDDSVAGTVVYMARTQ